MAWDADEIPISQLHARIERLQAAMATAHLDALILYTNFVRSAAVSHLTAFSPYWADGILLMPLRGEPVFATTLSKRVGSWIQSVKPVGDLVTSPTPGTVLAQRLAAGNVRRVGILELDDFPAGLYGELSTALPGVEIVDASEVFAAARAPIDRVERQLLLHAENIANGALTGLQLNASTDVGSAVGMIEKQARLHGAEEAYIAIAPDLDKDRRFLRLSGTRPLGRRFAIRATVAYKGAWIRHTQTYSSDARDLAAIARADAWFRTFVAQMDPAKPLSNQISTAMTEIRDAQISGWLAEAAVGTRPLAVIASSKDAAPVHAPLFVLTLGMTIDGVPWSGAALAGAVLDDSP
jgi:hypothetical protein